ncbi:hypothetical protein SDC9_124950 [bioreactor metagenome]|uniref:Uncharacterized protein n=1 Tax=bioreactor metagenome TaxID=1076179 RepID=A0A645CLM7_9ZZZZ
MRTNQHDVVPNRRVGNIGQVNHHLIHADGADLPRAFAAHEHVRLAGEAALVPVAVANRDGANQHVAGGHELEAVAHAFAGGDRLDVRNVRVPAHHGTQVIAFNRVSGGVAAVHRDAAAHHVKLRIGQMQRSRAVACVQNRLEAVFPRNGDVAAEAIRL